MDEKELENKLVFSTFHQAKGLERNVIFVYNFDSSYFEFYDKDSDENVCPNTMYVAVTRAKKKLILLHSSSIKIFYHFWIHSNLEKQCQYYFINW